MNINFECVDNILIYIIAGEQKIKIWGGGETFSIIFIYVKLTIFFILGIGYCVITRK